MYMILYVANDFQQAKDMVHVWTEAGIRGITILESVGLQQLLRSGVLRDDLGPMPSLRSLLRGHEIEMHRRTIFSAVEDEEVLNRVLRASEAFVGDWTQPDVGVLFVWPILHAYGLNKDFDTGGED